MGLPGPGIVRICKESNLLQLAMLLLVATYEIPISERELNQFEPLFQEAISTLEHELPMEGGVLVAKKKKKKRKKDDRQDRQDEDIGKHGRGWWVVVGGWWCRVLSCFPSFFSFLPFNHTAVQSHRSQNQTGRGTFNIPPFCRTGK